MILFVIASISVVLSMGMKSNDIESGILKIETMLKDSEVNFDNIEEIEIKRDGVLFIFNKVDSVWWQSIPFEMRMDHPSMVALVETMQSVQVLGELSSTSEVEVLGLGDCANYMKVSDGLNGVSILLGRKTLGGRAYAQLNQAEPVLVDQSLHRRVIDMDYRLWRDIRIFPEFAIDGTRIERDIDGTRLLIERQAGIWKMLEPVSTRIDQEMFAEWVGRIAAARVVSFVVDEPSDLALFGLHVPSATFATSDRNGKTYKLWIGGKVSAGTEDRYVMIENKPVVFRMEWDALSKLFPLPELLVDATGSSVSRFDVKQVTIRSNGNETKVKRDLERWVDGDGVLVDIDIVDALLTWILETKPPKVSFGTYPRQDEIATLTFEGYDLLPLDTVRIARLKDGTLILENGDNVLRIHPSQAGTVLTPFIR